MPKLTPNTKMLNLEAMQELKDLLLKTLSPRDRERDRHSVPASTAMRASIPIMTCW